MKHRSSGAQGVRCFPLADPLTYFALTANEKDFSLSLEMTNACEAAFSYRHPERSRGIFFVCRVSFPVWNGLHETPFFSGAGSRVFPACRSSHSLCLAANEKDFSLSLEMTNAGKRHSRIESHLYEESVNRYSPSFPWKEVPQRGGGWHRAG